MDQAWHHGPTISAADGSGRPIRACFKGKAPNKGTIGIRPWLVILLSTKINDDPIEFMRPNDLFAYLIVLPPYLGSYRPLKSLCLLDHCQIMIMSDEVLALRTLNATNS